jgi:hypothetical protein
MNPDSADREMTRTSRLILSLVAGLFYSFMLSLFTPTRFAPLVLFLVICGACLCGWDLFGEPRDFRPVFLAFAVAGAVGLYQHYEGTTIPGHWFERGADYETRVAIRIRHAEGSSTTYTVPADVLQRERRYILHCVHFPNGGRPTFDDDTPLEFGKAVYLAATSGERWYATLLPAK